jgi:antitoxin component HigA of HigAB toxin-antitoxin module
MIDLPRYEEFLHSKIAIEGESGIEVSDSEIHPVLKPHQRVAVQWACRGARRALFERFGLGKTIQQLEICRLLLKHIDDSQPTYPIQRARSLIICPLGVRQEFTRDAVEKLQWSLAPRFIRTTEELLRAKPPTDSPNVFLTNYESVRDGKLDPSLFEIVSLDEASCLRGFGGTKTFREFMSLFAGDRKTFTSRTRSQGTRFRFVATATPSPNDYIELLAYAAFLGIMDVSAAKTRFFKRDSTKADNLTLHPHKEEEFWLWVSSWALFLQKPSDLGFSDEGYDLPPIKVIKHEVRVNHANATPDRNGQNRMFREAMHGVVEAAREKRDTLTERVAKMTEILESGDGDRFLIWHDLEAERHAISAAVPDAVAVYGTQDLEKREQSIIDFSNGKIQYLAAKPVLAGSGCNFQRYCHKAIFLGIGFKFNDFIQAIHRIQRYLQTEEVEIHIIYAESERRVLQILERKWEQHEVMVAKMSAIIKQYGLAHSARAEALGRKSGIERVELSGANWTTVNNDAVLEAASGADNSVHLILTSIPFSTQYEYSPNYSDFGHSDTNEHFFQQMDFLTPNLLRMLQPGRIAAIHVKDRVVPGGLTGLGFQTVYPFHCRVIEHYTRHGFGYLGMKTIVTDVVRENNQTYRLGWSEQCKDGTKMGVGMPEYLLLFRKPPTDSTNSYADLPVVKAKEKYTRSRWQTDAHGFARSNGNRPLTPGEIASLPHSAIFKLFREYSRTHVYDFEEHVRLAESLETCGECSHIHVLGSGDCVCGCKGSGRLPVTFMLLQPVSWSPDVWTDITRMLTLNSSQYAKGRQMHLCPLQLDIADRVINQLTNPGETVLDPFMGIGTVPSRAVALGRKGLGWELAHSYFVDGAMYCAAAEKQVSMPMLFDVLEGETEGAAA